jgi:tetratricopeptide (TPR) repeat protein
VTNEITPRRDRSDAGARPVRLRPDAVVVACVLVVLALPGLALLSVSRQPVVPERIASLPSIRASGPAGAVRDLPVLAPGGGARPAGAEALRRAVDEAIDGVFSGRQAARLRRYLKRARLGKRSAGSLGVGGPDPYPYRYEGLDDLLGAALPAKPDPAEASAESQLGALLVLAEAAGAFPRAGQVAFAILDRARRAGACDAQLNLAFLVAAANARDQDVAREMDGADRACPRDPTALWLQAQWRSAKAADEGYSAATIRSLSLFARLQRRFPRSAAGWAGEADVLLRMAYVADEQRQAFTARSRFTRALALYRHARALDAAPELGAGEARALAGLRRLRRAVAVQARAAIATRRPAALQARLVDYLERAGAFRRAAVEARRLAADPRLPDGRALTVKVESNDAALTHEDALEPLSIGAGRVRPVALDIAPRGSPRSAPGPGASPVEDLSFVPRVRFVEGVTGSAPWCPDWAARRDDVIAGRPGAALAHLPKRFASSRDVDEDCPADTTMLKAVALAMAGQRTRALATIGRIDGLSGQELAALYDAGQNMWRFAGRLAEAGKVTAAWTRARPADPGAFDQAGEVAFLRGRYVAAARLFGTSAQLTREQKPGWPLAEPYDLVKQGASLKLAARDTEALAVLNHAAEVAARSLAGRDSRAETESYPRYGDSALVADVNYQAHLQIADVLLSRHRYAAAVDEYAVARRHAEYAEQDLPEVLDNNEAIAEIYAGNPAGAKRLALRAIAVDPMNPLFLQTMGFALARQGRPRSAAVRYGRAVAADPSLYPAWNDLGVMLARAGRDEDAVAALRRAIGARADYALAWFNLGIMLGRRGLLDAPAAEGALGRAFRLDPDLASRKRVLVTDERLTFTRLDLSKPLPREWDFASSQQRSPLPAAGLALLLLLGLQAARAAGGRGLTGGAARWIETARALLARLPGALSSFAPSAVAVVASVAVFVWPAIRGDVDGAGIALLALGLIALVALVLRARVLVARRAGVEIRQRAWRPAILVAAAGAVAGIPWAPLPVVEPDRPESRVHLVGPAVAAATGLVLLILSAWLGLPVTRSLGIAAVVVAASMLTPLKPLDGALIEGVKGVLPAGLVGGTALLIGLGLL